MLDTTTNSASFRGGEGQSVFPIPFPFLETAHIRAYILDPGGAKRALAAGIDYSVNRISDANGELILLGSDLPEGNVLTICRLVPLTQEILFHNQGPNSPRAMEEAADKLTMIAQQLQTGIDNCLSIPDGSSADDVLEIIADSARQIAEVKGDIGSLAAKLNSCAPLVHVHAVAGVTGLADALSAKADKTQLQSKAERNHRHTVAEVDGLTAALAAKLDVDDPRLGAIVDDAAPHAATHAAAGADPIRPEDIGALSAPPADGKPYLAAAGGWIEYIAPVGGGGDGGGGTLDHSQLANRDAADQHPQSAILNLCRDLDSIRGSVANLEHADEAITAALSGKAGTDQLPQQATADADGLLAASDKRKLDALPETFSPLPGGGQAGDMLIANETGGGVWTGPAHVAGTLPLMSATQKGVARLAADAGLELDAGGALRIRADSLISKTNIEARLTGFDGRLETLDTRTVALPDRLETAEIGVTTLGDRLDSLGAMAGAADAPRNGKPHARQDGGWVEVAGGSGGAIVGEIRFFPFRATELPQGWYFCNGDKYSLSTAQGDALNSLPALLKSDWSIVAGGGSINLPNLFGTGGVGYFLRAVDGVGRMPGTKQPDAIRNITGTMAIANNHGIVWSSSNSGVSTLTGAFKATLPTKSTSFNSYSHGYNAISDLSFDASGCVPVSSEVRPVNVGMTPAIYLGV